jgi:hypothetical protein
MSAATLVWRLGHALKHGQWRHEVARAHQDERPTALGRKRQVAGILDGIPRALLRLDEQRLGGGRAAVPAEMQALDG